MHIPLRGRNKRLSFAHQCWTLNVIGQSLLLSTGVVLCLNFSAKAADRVVLRFEETQVTVPMTNIKTFVATGEAQTPEFQDFAQKHPKAREILQKVLNKEITFSGKFKERLSKSSVGEFVLTQVDKLINSGGTGVQDLRVAFQETLKSNNQVSILRLLENYPSAQVSLDVAALERGYENLQAFVERFEPALEAIKATLQDFICDCEKPATKSLSQSSTSPSGLVTDRVSPTAQPTQSACAKD